MVLSLNQAFPCPQGIEYRSLILGFWQCHWFEVHTHFLWFFMNGFIIFEKILHYEMV